MINSKSDTIILQMQDWLCEDETCRMNIPGQAAGCWEYRVPRNYKQRFSKTLEKVLTN